MLSNPSSLSATRCRAAATVFARRLETHWNVSVPRLILFVQYPPTNSAPRTLAMVNGADPRWLGNNWRNLDSGVLEYS